jgi:hypothetical protein
VRGCTIGKACPEPAEPFTPVAVEKNVQKVVDGGVVQNYTNCMNNEMVVKVAAEEFQDALQPPLPL